MKNNSLKVALNMTTLSVPEKIRKATAVVDALTTNADVFTAPDPDLKTISETINNLNTAYLATADGGKSKTAAMHDLENDLMKQMTYLAAYIEQVADGDESTVHLSALDVKKKVGAGRTEFSVTPKGHGQAILQVKARKGSVYKWQYSANNGAATTAWVDALYSKVSKVSIQGLAAGVYFFRVIFIEGTSEHESSTLNVAVN
jgi:hypothetical protein